MLFKVPMKLGTYYQQRKSEAESALKDTQKKILHVSISRIVLFIVGCIGLFCLHNYDTWILICIIGCTLIPFLALLKKHNQLFLQKDWWEASIKHYQAEIEALQGNISSFADGKEFIETNHPYCIDLDLFGIHSLFQTINRTCTPLGKKTLALWMKEHLKEKTKIEERQTAIKELVKHNDFREKFRITGLLFKKEEIGIDDMEEWIKAPYCFSTKRWCQRMIWIVPSLNLLFLFLGLIGIISMSYIGISFGCFVIASFGLVKKITRIQNDYNKKLKVLSTYIKLIQLVETEELQSSLLITWKKRFRSNELQASSVLELLDKELDRLDLRNNQLLYFLLEGSLFWQLRQIIRIEQWKQTYGENLLIWLDTLAKIDAILSLGTFAFNHPHYTYPTIADTPFIFQSQEMGHPLIPDSQCVKNNANIPFRPYFIIITGANMAGKSTYLRTIGCNYLLACIGAPVCCASLKIYPAQLMTSLRTNDSLSDNESYFFAELKRLKQIIDRLNQKEEMFIILDEILKGTNSKDKQKGSLSLIQQLMALQANGIIATHDLLLGELEKHFPKGIKNYCFEADIQGDTLTFSYKLREGIAQNMNACFLMNKMGLIIND